MIAIKHTDPKVLLLYRFHLVVILINLLALTVDSVAGRYSNVAIELGMVFLLLFSLGYLRKEQNLTHAAHLFTAIVSTGLFALIYLNHFATMSIVFILLLPLMTLLFFDLKESLLITLLLFFVMGVLLYAESLYNPSNPLIQNPQAIFNLLYTAVIVYVFGLLYHFSILRTFRELDAANRQKALLLKEVHHRVKNNLNVIASIIGLQENRLEGKEREALLKSKSRIESIALVHEMLYRDENFESIDFGSYMRRLSDLLLGMYGSNRQISVQIVNDTQNISLDVMVQLGIMVNELLTNSIKYAFETEEREGKIEIGLHRENEQYLFTYSDNGKGHPNPQTLRQSNSLGLKLIYLTAKQLKGDLQIASSQGLHYELRFTL